MFEHFSPYVQTNGLVLQKSYFSDLKLQNQIEEKSIFENREDCLTDIHTNLNSRSVVEHFKPGREDCLKKHSYNLDAENKAETERTFNFFENCRADGLLELIETEDSIIGMSFVLVFEVMLRTRSLIGRDFLRFNWLRAPLVASTSLKVLLMM